MNDRPGYALGIDLGTTFTAAATWSGSRADTVVLDSGARSIPSAVLVEDDGRVVVGAEARARAAGEPDRVALGFKRSFGGDVGILLGGREVPATELTAHLLHRVVAAVVKQRDGAAPSAVTLTVPATWQDYRLGLMDDVVAKADLPSVPVAYLPEPAAAAIFYAGREHVDPGTVFGVYDFGGGTFDATVLRKTTDGFEILGVPLGADDVGGMDVDHALLRLALDRAGRPWPSLDRSDDAVRRGLAMLRDAVIEAKELLARAATSPARAPRSTTVPVHLPRTDAQVTVTLQDLEQASAELVDVTVGVMVDVVSAAGLETGDLDRILLVGGSSRLPTVARRLTEELGRDVVEDAHPKYAVCLGAAVAAGAVLEAQEVARPPVEQRVAPTGRDAGTPAARASETSVTVDLQASGLTSAAEVPVRPAAEVRHRLRRAPDEPLTVTLGGDARPGARNALLVLVALAALVAAILAVLGR